MTKLRLWIFCEVLGVSQRYLKGTYPRLWLISLRHVFESLRLTPTQNGRKTDLRVRSKMAKSRFFCFFSCCGPSGAWYMAQTFHMGSSYSIGIFSQKNFFSTHLPWKKFRLQKFSKIWVVANLPVPKDGGWGCRGDPRFFQKRPK